MHHVLYMILQGSQLHLQLENLEQKTADCYCLAAGQVGGRVVVYNGLTFSTVRAAGHMVSTALRCKTETVRVLSASLSTACALGCKDCSTSIRIIFRPEQTDRCFLLSPRCHTLRRPGRRTSSGTGSTASGCESAPYRTQRQ